jgi:molybdopterin-synthase adenylyltransferase
MQYQVIFSRSASRHTPMQQLVKKILANKTLFNISISTISCLVRMNVCAIIQLQFLLFYACIKEAVNLYFLQGSTIMSLPINELLSGYGEHRLRPDGTPYISLSHSKERLIADQAACSLKEVQVAALQKGIIPERYCRNQSTLSSAEQITLLGSHVAVIGQGGLGGTVTEILARLGIGTLTLVDGDIFEESNLNRQLLSTIDSLGMRKADAGRQRVQAINPAVEVNTVTEFFTEKNGSAILKNVQLAVDCLDSIPSRFILEEACRRCNIPMVSAAIGGNNGQAMVIYPEDVGLRQIYSNKASAPQKGVEKRLGTPCYTATFMAAIECVEIVAVLCKNVSSLRNRLLMVNLEDKSIEKISFT